MSTGRGNVPEEHDWTTDFQFETMGRDPSVFDGVQPFCWIVLGVVRGLWINLVGRVENSGFLGNPFEELFVDLFHSLVLWCENCSTVEVVRFGESILNVGECIVDQLVEGFYDVTSDRFEVDSFEVVCGQKTVSEFDEPVGKFHILGIETHVFFKRPNVKLFR